MWEPELGQYLGHLAARGLPKDTVRHRRNKVRQMLSFLEASGIAALQEVSREHIDRYLAYLGGEYRTEKGAPISVSHLREHHLCVKDFFSWMERQGRILQSPYGRREMPRRVQGRLPEVLSPQEAVRVLESVDPRTGLGLRDRAMLEILYSTGMRKGELVGLNVADFSFERQEIAIVKSKSRKGRVVPVGEYARHFTECYLRTVRPWLVRGDEEKALFVSQRSGGRLSVRTVGKIVGQAVRGSGLAKTVTPHTFRHSMASHMLRNRADLRHIQAILGHAQITSTEIYTHVTLEDLKEVVRRAHPHGRKGQ
jgi:integrase/recombinase XerD